jgi:hypothetical protein
MELLTANRFDGCRKRTPEFDPAEGAVLNHFL